MFYVDKNKYKDLFKEVAKCDVCEYQLEKQGYSVLHSLNSVGELTDVPVNLQDKFCVNFVIIFRSDKSNLVAVKNDSFAIPVEIDSYPQGATFDDLILLHGKRFIDKYVSATDILEFIPHTLIQPWGVVLLNDELYVPIEIVVEDEALVNKLGNLNANFVNDTREGVFATTKARNHLINGFTPISNVNKYLFSHISTFTICHCIRDNLKEVK